MGVNVCIITQTRHAWMLALSPFLIKAYHTKGTCKEIVLPYAGSYHMHLFTDILHWATTLPPAGLYIFIFAWLFVESTGFPISDEPLLLLAGVLTTRHRIELLPVLIFALIGKVAASCLAYWLGMHIPLMRLARPAQQPATGMGRWLYHVRPTAQAIETVEERFRRQGVWGVFLGRLIPVVRSFISYPAGTARMRFDYFLGATTAGSLIWIVAWTCLGAFAGKSAQAVKGPVSFALLGAALVAIAGVWIWNHRRQTHAANVKYNATQPGPTTNANKPEQSPTGTTTHVPTLTGPTTPPIAKARKR
jgi:membrane protein DedA with SNARE-associated domain